MAGRATGAASIDDVRRAARRRLPRLAFEFIDGGAEDEVTLRANRAAFERVVLRPRFLTDVSERDQSTTVLGTPVSSPVLLAPTGLSRLASRGGEVDAARAAARAGTVFTLSTSASCSIEEVAAASDGPRWFQLYLWRRRDIAEQLIERARAAGYSALVVTVDVPVIGKRERDLRNGFTLPPRLTLGTGLDMLRHPRWLYALATSPPITFRNFIDFGRGDKAVTLARLINEDLCYPGASYRDLDWLRETWQGPLLVKGTLTAEDAELLVAHGVDGIVVSNHGGRQLDGAPASLDCLPEVVEAVAGRAEVFLDGGIRRGGDVVKAIALGARACLIGRPFLYGLAMAGEAGVLRVLELLREEIDTTLALIGRRSLAELDASAVRRDEPVPAA